MASKSKRGKRRHHGLRGSDLIHAVKAFRAEGLKEKEIVKRCGYRDPSFFSRMLESAYAKRKSRQLALERMTARDDLDRSDSGLREARELAQRRLARGEKLTPDEFNALPDYQKIALLKSVRPLPAGSNKASRGPSFTKPAQLSNTQQILKPRVLKGNALLEKVRMLSVQRHAEINIAIKCGYGSERLGQFRGELARVIGCKIAPLDRLLDQARRAQ